MAQDGTWGSTKARQALSFRPALVNLWRQIHFFQSQSLREKATRIQISGQPSPAAPKVMKHWYLLLLSVIADIQIMMPIPSLGRRRKCCWASLFSSSPAGSRAGEKRQGRKKATPENKSSSSFRHQLKTK